MDLLGAYDSDSDSGGGGGPSPPAVREDAATEAKKPAATKRVVKLYPVTDMKALADEEDYRPRKRQQTERRGSSLFDSLPKPQTELHDWGSRAAAEKKGKGEAPRDVAGVGGRHQDFPSDSRAPSSSGAGGVTVDAAPQVPTNPNDMYRVGAGGQYAFDYGAYYAGQGAAGVDQAQQPSTSGTAAGPRDGAQAVLELALEEERRRKAKRGGRHASAAAPKVTEVNQMDLMGGYADLQPEANPIRDALGEGYEEKLRREASGHQPNRVARQKHQIGSLYHQSKVLELELLTNRAKSLKTKRETQAKYGW